MSLGVWQASSCARFTSVRKPNFDAEGWDGIPQHCLTINPGGRKVGSLRAYLMPLTRPPLLWIAFALTSASSALGCADARGRFDDFETRLHAQADSGGERDDDAGADGGGACAPPPPNSVVGPALLALDTSLAAGKPILFLGTIDTPELDGTTAVHFMYQALDAHDRTTLVGSPLDVGPYPIAEGALVAAIPALALDGRANPQFYGATITSEMTLRGRICGVASFYCGTLDGAVTGLLTGTFSGHFGITLLNGANIPDRPRFGCAATDLADPLPASSP